MAEQVKPPTQKTPKGYEIPIPKRRPHLAGSLGVAMTRRFFESGWIVRVRVSRAVRVTDRGGRALSDELGLQVESSPRTA